MTTYSHFVDPFDRRTETDYLIGWVLNQYHIPVSDQTEVDSYAPVGYTGSASASCTNCTHSQSMLDSLGRVVTDSLVNNPAGQVYVNYGYDGLNRVTSTSHPNFGSSDPNDVLESTRYDGLGRSLQVAHPDGQLSRVTYGVNVSNLGGVTTQQSSTTTYGYGFPLAAIDEGGKQRQEWIDGFGHVIEVDEPSATTSTPGQGSVTIDFNSSEVSYTFDPCQLSGHGSCPATAYNSGTVSVTVNGFTGYTTYGPLPPTGPYSTSLIATSLASQFNVPDSPVTAVASGSSVTFTAIGEGANTNFSFTASATYDNGTCYNQPCFSGPSFYPSPTSGMFSGGTGGVASSPLVTTYTYDALGNLTGIVQGAQTRSWTYDGLTARGRSDRFNPRQAK